MAWQVSIVELKYATGPKVALKVREDAISISFMALIVINVYK